MGYPLIGRFAKDFKRYAADRGIEFKSEQLFLPKSKEQALDFILPSLKEENPVAFLILRHPAYELREDNWHWVTITGFDEEKELLIWSNCGEREEIDWNMLFDTDKKYYVSVKVMDNNGECILRIRDNVNSYNPFDLRGDEVDRAVMEMIKKKAKYYEYQRKLVFNYLYVTI